MSVRQWVIGAVTPAARKVSSAVVFRLVGYAIVRRAVGFDALKEHPWGMSQSAIYATEKAFHRSFGLSSDEWCTKYLGQLLEVEDKVS